MTAQDIRREELILELRDLRLNFVVCDNLISSVKSDFEIIINNDNSYSIFTDDHFEYTDDARIAARKAEKYFR